MNKTIDTLEYPPNCSVETKNLIDRLKNQHNLEKYWKEYITVHNRRCLNLLQGNDAKTFELLAKQVATVDGLHLLFLGTSDDMHSFGRVVLYAETANNILQHLQKVMHESVFYQFIHAVCPHVIDVWNLYSESVIDCYYRNFGELNQIPLKKSQIEDLWSCTGQVYKMNKSNDCLGDCKVCCESVDRITKSPILCRNCNSLYHVNCIGKWLQLKPADQYQCPCCQISIDMSKPDNPLYFFTYL